MNEFKETPGPKKDIADAQVAHRGYIRGCKPELVEHLIRAHGHIYPDRRGMLMWRIDELVSTHARDHEEDATGGEE